MTTSIPEVDSTVIKHGLLVDLTVNTTTYHISNLYSPITWDGKDYTQLGHFLNMTELQGDLKATNNQISMSMSGIPPDDGSPNYMSVVLNSNLKGSRIEVFRVFFDVETGAVANAYLRYSGYVTNYSLSENWDQDSKLTSNTIGIQCSSIHAIMEKQYSGRRTNEQDQQYWYPGDTGMYRVKSLADTNFDFGKPA